jgi:hypothetical protein
MEDVTIVAPDSAKVRDEVDGIALAAELVAVTDEASAAHATDFVREVKAHMARVEAFFEPSIKAAHTTHKLLCAQRNELLAPLQAVDAKVRGRLNAWADSERRKREEEARLERERARKAEEERQLNEAAAREAEGSAPADLDEAAAVADLRGSIAEEQALAAAPAPKIAGASVRVTWTAHVTDKPALIAYVAQHPEVQHYLEPNQKLLDSMAKQMKDQMRVPGVRVVSNTTTAIR